MEDVILGLASGGQISQDIIRDTLPVTSYNGNRATRLHISVLNAVCFSHITGRPAPPSPVSAETYLEHGLPWYTLYDETLPRANNYKGGNLLTYIQSVATLMRQMLTQGTEMAQPECTYCDDELATWRLLPCRHSICDDCASGMRNPSVCPAINCEIPVRTRERFAAPMPLPGNEAGDGVEASSLDGRIVRLQRCAERGVVGTFKLDSKRVSLPFSQLK